MRGIFLICLTLILPLSAEDWLSVDGSDGKLLGWSHVNKNSFETCNHRVIDLTKLQNPHISKADVTCREPGIRGLGEKRIEQQQLDKWGYKRDTTSRDAPQILPAQSDNR